MMLEIDNLKKTFDGGTKALQGVNLKVKKGEFLTILGPSGSGKTTLLRSINGLEKIESGKIFFDGSREQLTDEVMFSLYEEDAKEMLDKESPELSLVETVAAAS